MQRREKLTRLLALLIAPAQELEDVFQSLGFDTLLDHAKDAQLDQWGEIVGAEREGMEDDLYRVFLLARIRVNISQGTPDDVTAIARLLAEDQGPAHLTPIFPAGFMVAVHRPSTRMSSAQIARLKEWLNQLLPAGVEMVAVVESPAIPFVFDHLSSNNPIGAGFGVGTWSDVV